MSDVMHGPAVQRPKEKLKDGSGRYGWQFLPMLSEEHMLNLKAINRALWTYVEREYHRSPHRSLGETPLDCWARVGQTVRYPEPDDDLDDLFLF